MTAVIRIDARKAPAGIVREIARALLEHPGNDFVRLELDTSMGAKVIRLTMSVNARDHALAAKLEQLGVRIEAGPAGLRLA